MCAVVAEASRMGDYSVLKRVAIGGMAEIFLARKDGPSGFERLVVLKRILPEYAHNGEFVRMFLNEARIAATLHHTNIVQVHSIGEEQGQIFFAMEFLHGEDLSRVLSRAGQIGRPLQLDAVLTIASAVCAGLHYAHERTGADGQPLDIVHRDVSPHNVFVTYDGNIKLLDFGIAKASTSIGKTRTGVLKGKVAYMSPEQAYSQPVDRRSDIFCIGILLWELSTGRRLYRRRSELETLKALVDEDAPRPSSVVSSYPVELEAIVMKCLARDPADRWTNCDELSQALEQFAHAQSLQVSPLIATRMMRSLFKTEIARFEDAIKSGRSMIDEVIERMEATARKASIDDWDSDVASVIVDDADRKSPVRAPVVAPARPKLPGLPQEYPVISRAALEVDQEPTQLTPMPFADAYVDRPVIAEAPAPRRRSYALIGGCVAAAVLAGTIFVVVAGGKHDKAAAPLPAAQTAKPEPPPPVAVPAPESEPPKPAAIVKAEPPVVIKPVAKAVVKAEPKVVKAAAVEAPKPVVKAVEAPRPVVKAVEAPKPVVKKPVDKPIEKPIEKPVEKPVEKKIEPKKPDKKPTAKDLDSLPL